MIDRTLTRKQQAGIKRLVTQCANYDSAAHNCLLGDIGHPVECAMFRKPDYICPCFKSAVLPLDPALEAALLKGGPRRVCQECGAEFIPASNRQKFCGAGCERARIRAKDRERKRRERAKARGNISA